MESFNPYRAWLGVTSNAQPPNHYELLGLRLLRAEPTEVAEAFQRQVSRLSGYLSGEHATIASRILSELASAKVELLTPTTKRIYDASLAAGNKPSDSAATDDWLPPAADPALVSSYVSGAPPAMPVMAAEASEPEPLAPMNPPLPPAHQPLPPTNQPLPLPRAAGPATAMPVTAMPVYGYQPPYAQAIPTAAVPYYGGQHPSAMSVGTSPYGAPMAAMPMAAPAPIMYAQAPQAYNSGQIYGSGPAYDAGMSAVADPEPYTSSVGSPATSVSARTAFRRQSSPVPMVVGVLAAGLLIVAGGFYALKSGSYPIAVEPNAQDGAQPRPKGHADKPRPSATKTKPTRKPGEQGQTAPGDGRSKPRLSDQPWPPKGDPKMVAAHDQASEAMPAMSDPAAPEPAKPGPAKPDPETPDPAKLEPAKPDMPAKPEPDAPAATPEAMPQQEAAVKRALAAARTALGKRDFETAQEQLDLATLDAVTPDLDAEVARVQLLEKYVEHFWKAVSETLPKLEVGEEFTINGVVAGVVEGRPDMLIVRVQGRNREYPLYEIPTKLAVMLAERWLDKGDEQTPVVIGAFLLADPKGDDQEARQLFKQAAAKGADVESLLKELDGR
ncbi:MAG TPA: hypothetical protein VMV69_07025 [Pirellulales bacterium]|nr:hypothetical protein [Pirellulales bacterium]